MSYTILDSNFLLHRILNLPTFFDMGFHGMETGGVYGVIKSLQITLQGAPAGNKVIAVWDGGHSARRKEIYKDYKANRLPKNEDEKVSKEQYYKKFAPQQKILEEQVFPALGINNIRIREREGDDTLYQVVKLLENEEILVISEDKDVLQLIHHFPKIRVYRPVAVQHVCNENFLQTMEIHPSLYLYAKAILGDDSDGITGIAGVGKVTVAQFMAKVLPNATPLDIFNLSKEIYDAEMTKKKLTRLAKIHQGWGTICRNLDLVDLSREQFSNLELEFIKHKIDTYDYVVHKDLFFNQCRTLGFQSIIEQLDFWIKAFQK